MSDSNLQELRPGWEHADLHRRVVAAIQSLPAHFDTQARIDGIHMADLARLGGALVSTIEEQVVATLNALRSAWDPANTYAAYSFIRHSQMFPGVRLCRELGSDDIIMGIDLSGWYVLAKEGVPTFRFLRSAAACAEQDLVVVVPWALSEVTHGTPVAFAPYVESAKRLATVRNEYWMLGRKTDADKTIESPDGVTPYPKKSEGIDDKPVADAGNNFGRIARTGLMSDYIAAIKKIELRDRTLAAWLADVESTRVEYGNLTPAPGRVL
ncbi:hypothetical protein [Sorangium sp. So ce513]|uniref:hypothetical protein n=1 Tax=Sorangium sp. So ce513 TaxID=3133315 RepID=UPI003F60A2AC